MTKATLAGSATTDFTAGEAVVLVVVPSDRFGNQVEDVPGYFGFALDSAAGRAAFGQIAEDNDPASVNRGSWLTSMTATHATRYTLNVTHHLDGADTALASFAIVVSPSVAAAPNTVVSSSSLTAEAGQVVEFSVQCFDEFSNAVTNDTIPISVEASRGDARIISGADVVSILPGTRVVRFSSTAADTSSGAAEVRISVAGEPAAVVSVAVQPAAVSATGSSLELGSAPVAAGESTAVTIRTRDKFSNDVTAAVADFTAVVKVVNATGSFETVPGTLEIVGAGEARLSFTPELAGRHGVHVTVAGSGIHVSNSPAAVAVVAGPVSPPHSVIVGGRGGMIGKELSLEVVLMDAYGNPCASTATAAVVVASITPDDRAASTVGAEARPTQYEGAEAVAYAVSYHFGTLANSPQTADLGLAGTKMISITVNGHALDALSVEIGADIGEVDGSQSEYSMPSSMVAGGNASISITARDSSQILVPPFFIYQDGSFRQPFTARFADVPDGANSTSAITAFSPQDEASAAETYGYTASVSAEMSGIYTLEFLLDSAAVHQLSIAVVPGPPTASECLVDGLANVSIVAGEMHTFSVTLRDSYANTILAPAPDVRVAVALNTSAEGAAAEGVWGCVYASAASAFECAGFE